MTQLQEAPAPPKLQTGVTFVIVRPSGEILMQQRDDGNGREIPYPNMWCIPGGGKTEDETHLETTVREIKDEYELEVAPENCRLLLSYDHDDVADDRVYVCPVPQNCRPVFHEGRDMQWKRIDDIREETLAWEQFKFWPRLKAHLAAH